jgi:homoserine kinase
MAEFTDRLAGVSVPATSANLGPGFDAVGLALSLRDRVRARVCAAGLVLEVAGAGADEVPRDESNLVLRSMRAAFDVLGGQPPGLDVRCDNVIPHGRGLGSSSSAIVAGVSLARALVTGGSSLLGDDALFALAARLEGHPDNVAAAFYGGLVISGREDGSFFTARVGVDPRVSAVVFVPPSAVSTAAARALLPGTVSHAEAAANAGRAALLVAALNGQPGMLHYATRDYLHQDFREPAMPRSLALMRELRDGQIPAIISGAGPAVLAFAQDSATASTGTGAGPEALLARCPDEWVAMHLRVETSGVRVS